MRMKILVHEAEEGGFWAEVPSLPGCVTEGETMEELLANVREAVVCYLDVSSTSPVPPRTTLQEVEL